MRARAQTRDRLRYIARCACWHRCCMVRRCSTWNRAAVARRPRVWRRDNRQRRDHGARDDHTPAGGGELYLDLLCRQPLGNFPIFTPRKFSLFPFYFPIFTPRFSPFFHLTLDQNFPFLRLPSFDPTPFTFYNPLFLLTIKTLDKPSTPVL
jgi:hypothetical protein